MKACSEPGAGVTLELFCQQNHAAYTYLYFYPWLKPRGTLVMQVVSVDPLWQPGNFPISLYCSKKILRGVSIMSWSRSTTADLRRYMLCLGYKARKGSSRCCERLEALGKKSSTIAQVGTHNFVFELNVNRHLVD